MEGALPNLVGRSHGQDGAGLPSLPGFAGGNAASYASLAPGLSATVSPVPSQQQGLKYEAGTAQPLGVPSRPRPSRPGAARILTS